MSSLVAFDNAGWVPPLHVLLSITETAQQGGATDVDGHAWPRRPVNELLLDMLDQSSTVDMVLPSVLAAVELMSPQDYNLLVRRDIKRLLNKTRSVQVTDYMPYQRSAWSDKYW